MGYCVRCGKMTSTAFPFCNKCFEKVLVRDTEVKYPRPQKAAFLHPKEGPAIGVVKAQINAAGDTKYYIGICTGDGNHGDVMQIIKTEYQCQIWISSRSFRRLPWDSVIHRLR